MKLVVTMLVTAMMALHAGLGCCGYHVHWSAEQEVTHVGHDCPHHGDTDERSDEHPQDCEDEQCLFVTAKSNTYTAAELHGTLTPWAFVTPALGVCGDHFNSSGSCNDSPHPNGPALHLWLGILVI